MSKKVFCIECQKYFENISLFQKEHEKISYKIMDIKHNPLMEENCLAYISELFSENKKNIENIKEQSIKIEKINSQLEYYQNGLKNDVLFECNIKLKNIENKINGKCIIHFLPKCIYFRIVCTGNILSQSREEFEIEILFPFKSSEIKFSSIEKLKGCLSKQKAQNMSAQEITIFDNYSSSIHQKNYLTSIKLLRHYSSSVYHKDLKDKNIDISINGVLTFSSFAYNLFLPFVMYNIENKKFICYENYQWKFVDNCFLKDGKIDDKCIVNLEMNIQSNQIFIKNQYKYLMNKPNFITTEKKDAEFNFKIYNEFYGIISIFNGGQFLSIDEVTGLLKFSSEDNHYLIYNI